jgi:hypothetical protein
MNRFFINFCSGARGDFLTNCLHDVESDWGLLINLRNGSKMPPPISYCVKTHGTFDHSIFTDIEYFPKKFDSWKELFKTVNDYKLIKLKIVAETFEERLDTVWFSHSKVILNDRGSRPRLSQKEIPDPTIELINQLGNFFVLAAKDVVPLIQNLDKEFQYEYDYIIKFEDLFNAEYIKDLYKKINGRDMDYARFKAIEKNIAMQYRISKSEFYPILKQRYNEIVIN